MITQVRRFVLPYCYVPIADGTGVDQPSSDELAGRLLFLCAWTGLDIDKKLYTGEVITDDHESLTDNLYNVFPAIETLFLSVEEPTSPIRTLQLYNSDIGKKGFDDDKVKSTILAHIKATFSPSGVSPIIAMNGSVRIYPLQVRLSIGYASMINSFNDYIKSRAVEKTNPYVTSSYRNLQFGWLTKENIVTTFPNQATIIADFFRAYQFTS